MKRSILIFSALFLVILTSIATDYPPDYDYKYIFIRKPPGGLSAGWAGEDAYITWNKTPSKQGKPADGYRLYRAASKDSMFVLIEKTTFLYSFYPNNEDIPFTSTATYYKDVSQDLINAGVALYEAGSFYYKVTGFVLRPIWGIHGLYTWYNVYESAYSAPVQVVKEIDTGFGCLIATAAFGSPFEYEVRTLCSFRDEVLMGSGLGRKLVGFYYKVSPPIADFIKERPVLRFLFRLHFKPVLKLCNLCLRLISKSS